MSRFLWGAFAGATTFGATEFFYNKRKIHIEYQEGQEQQTESQHDPDKAAAGRSRRGWEILKYGAPARGPDVKFYTNHVLCYDQAKKIPLWVAEHLSRDTISGSTANRQRSKFKEDDDIPQLFRSQNGDYWDSGWSRGHMAAAGDHKHSQDAMDDTFYLTNVVPQNFENNGGFWNRFEIYCRELTERWRDVRVISGPLVLPGNKDDKGHARVSYSVIGENEVTVPTHIYKVVVVEQGDNSPPAYAAFIVPNEPIGFDKKLTDYKVALETLERRSGLRFHPTLRHHAAHDLCARDSCELMGRDQFELYIISRKLKNAKTLHRLEKVWAELEEKNLKPDAWAENTYNTKRAELMQKEKSEAVSG